MHSFEFRRIEKGTSLYQDVLALRYRVYIEQRGFEKPEDHPQGIEQDVFDPHSVHFAAIHQQSKEVVGTIRLVLHSSEKDFPIESAFEFDKTLPPVDRSYLGEVSRLALCKEYCQEFRGRLLGGSESVDIVNGLLQRLLVECRTLRLTHLYAVMAKGLPMLLRRKGIRFPQIGPEKEYHGLRAPYFDSIENILRGNRELYACYAGPEAVLDQVA